MMDTSTGNCFDTSAPEMKSQMEDTAEKSRHLNTKNPFENTLENTAYRSDYRKILPQVIIPDFHMPLFPEKTERRGIRRFFNAAGWGILLSTLAEQILFTILLYIILAFMGVTLDAYSTDDSISSYLNNSSIFIALNGIVYASVNFFSAYLGCHSIQTPIRSLFQTENLKIRRIFMYISIGIGLQYAAGILYTWVSSFFASSGIELTEADFSYFQSTKSTIAVFLYTCILAPITEELLFRGFLMKALSCVSIRFGIVTSALIFGLAHGNVEQFLLAFIVGLFFGKIVVRHNSIMPSIWVHIGINTLSLLFNLADEKLTSDTGLMILMLLDMVYIAIAIIGILFWLWRERKEPLPYPTQKQSIRIRIFWTSPALLGAIVLQILIMIFNNILA